MKNFLPAFVLIFILSLQLNSQTVASTCAGAGTLVAKYTKDAARMALRRSYYKNTTYTDSARIEPVLKKTYLDALLAVYNATALPIRDTVVGMLDIHTDPGLELNAIVVNANAANAWMQQLKNSVVPTNYLPIDQLMQKYYLTVQTYFQATQYDEVILHTDTNSNMAVIAAKFAAETTVLSCTPNVSYNDVKHITDSLNPAFTLLSYSYGWGTCQDGCDFRSYWAFKVYTADCSVEYMGHAGDNLVATGTGIKETTSAFINMLVYPNPAGEKLYLKFADTMPAEFDLEVLNPLGQTLIQKHFSNTGTYEIDLNGVSRGIYFVRLKNEAGSRIVKLLKE